MGRRYRLSEKTKRFFLITLLLTPACYQIMPEIRMALVLAAMGEAVLSADRIWARNERFPFANLYDDRNPLYVRKMMKKRKWLSGINGYFVVQILLLSYVLLMTAGFISDHIIHRRYQEIRLEFFWIYWGIIMSLGVVRHIISIFIRKVSAIREIKKVSGCHSALSDMKCRDWQEGYCLIQQKKRRKISLWCLKNVFLKADMLKKQIIY